MFRDLVTGPPCCQGKTLYATKHLADTNNDPTCCNQDPSAKSQINKQIKNKYFLKKLLTRNAVREEEEGRAKGKKPLHVEMMDFQALRSSQFTGRNVNHDLGGAERLKEREASSSASSLVSGDIVRTPF